MPVTRRPFASLHRLQAMPFVEGPSSSQTGAPARSACIAFRRCPSLRDTEPHQGEGHGLVACIAFRRCPSLRAGVFPGAHGVRPCIAFRRCPSLRVITTTRVLRRGTALHRLQAMPFVEGRARWLLRRHARSACIAFRRCPSLRANAGAHPTAEPPCLHRLQAMPFVEGTERAAYQMDLSPCIAFRRCPSLRVRKL